MAKRTCLFPGCKEDPHSRGLCKPHYQNAYRLVTRGKTTWKKLVTDGKATPALKVDKKSRDWFLHDKKPSRTKRIREKTG